jgi:hypothetical protein
MIIKIEIAEGIRKERERERERERGGEKGGARINVL